MSSSYLESKINDIQEQVKKGNELINSDNSFLDGSNPFRPGSRPGSGRRPQLLVGGLGGTPTRQRKQYDNIPGSNFTPPTVDSTEIDNKMKEIMEMSGVICVNGQKYKSNIRDLEQLGELGSGTCGHVVKMLHKPSQCVMAVKQMRWSGDIEENKRITMDLDVVLKSHDCNYIVNCYGVFINDADVWICMELMATCFDKLLKKLTSPIPEDILGKVALSTVKALHYLKERHDVIHRDIKPSNILLDTHGNVKLCDFGISGRLVNSKAKSGNPGCAAYMSPERISPLNPGSPDYDIRADVWSLGITLVELATGQLPYTDCKVDFEVLSRVLQDDPPTLPADGNFTKEFHEFINSCLCKNYHQRPKYKKLLQYPFLQRYERKHVDVASWFALATQSARLTPNPVRKRSILFWSPDKKKRDPSPVADQTNSSGDQKSKSDSDGIKSVWSTIMKSPFFHRRKKSADSCVSLPPNSVNNSTQTNDHSLPLSASTSPILLQRFIHQQIQHINGLRRVHRSTSISPTPRFGDNLEKDLLAEMKRLRLEDNTCRITNTSPSPEPPPRINKMVSPLLLRRIAYNNMPEAEIPSFASLTTSPCLHRCGIPPQPPPRRKPFESNSVPCSPVPHHRYQRGPNPWGHPDFAYRT